MDVKEKKDVNRIIIIGPIVGKFANGVATNITIRTPRINMPTNAKEGDSCYNYPEIAFYGDDKTQINEAFSKGDIVRIEASIQSQRKPSPDGGRDHFEQKYVGTSIPIYHTHNIRQFLCWMDLLKVLEPMSFRKMLSC